MNLNFPGFTRTQANPREIINVPNYDDENAYYGAVRLIHDIESYLEELQPNLEKRKVIEMMYNKNTSKKITNKTRNKINKILQSNKQETDEEIDVLLSFMQDIDSFYEEIDSLQYHPEDFLHPMEYNKKIILQKNMLKTLRDLKNRVEDTISSMIPLTYGGRNKKIRKTRKIRN